MSNAPYPHPNSGGSALTLPLQLADSNVETADLNTNSKTAGRWPLLNMCDILEHAGISSQESADSSR